MTARELVRMLRNRGQTIATCESLTAGLAAARIADIPGASSLLRGGFITYTAEMKIRLAGVDPRVIELWGVVSDECARAMAVGTRERTGADWAVSLTGVAGPGSYEGHPAGEVHLGVAGEGQTWVRMLRFPQSCSRADVRRLSVDEALAFVIECLGMTTV